MSNRSKPHHDKRDVVELILLALDGDISKEDFEILQDRIIGDPEARNDYYAFLTTYIGFSSYESSHVLMCDGEDRQEDYLHYLQALGADEKTAPAIEFSEDDSRQELIQHVVYPPRQKRTISKLGIASLIVSAAAVILLVLFVKIVPHQPYSVEVATLVDQIHVQWAQSGTHPETGGRLWTNEGPLDLKKGVVKLRYDDGVDVVIEGPASFEIERSGIYLEYGRLYSEVSETGIGFTVETPTSQFIDLGTEFGVQADINGSSELHVLKGNVQLFAGSRGRSKAGQMVTENTAARYNSHTGQINPIAVAKTAFVRHIDSDTQTVWRGQTDINLATIVSGGTGLVTTGRPTCIRPDTGKVSLRNKQMDRAGDFVYHPVAENVFVDGVFVPSIEQGVAKVSSAGHEFTACPPTSNRCWGAFFNTKDFKEIITRKNAYLVGSLEKIDSDSLFMHANGGITFDLDAIRVSYQRSVKAFRTDYLFNHRNRTRPGDLYIDIWILVDGEVRYQKTDMTVSDTVFPIQLPISDQDRFLSLVVTDGSDDSTDNVWGIFVEPALILEND